MIVPDLSRDQALPSQLAELQQQQLLGKHPARDEKKAVAFGRAQQPTQDRLKQIVQDKSRADAGKPQAKVVDRAASPENKPEEVTSGKFHNQQTCPQGTALYFCSNGFHGCADTNPCTGGKHAGKEQMPLANGAAPALSTALQGMPMLVSTGSSLSFSQQAITNVPSSTQEPAPVDTLSISQRVKPLVQTVPVASTATQAAPLTVRDQKPVSKSTAQQPPPCPQANNTTYLDPSSVKYTIYCNKVNTAVSYDLLPVGAGGYSECFSSCSSDQDCAGFTYVGSDSGSCYFKTSMPGSSSVDTTRSSYVSCVKQQHTSVEGAIDDTTEAPDTIISSTSNLPRAIDGHASSHKGAIIGGSLFAVIFAALILFIVFLAIRRHRNGNLLYRYKRIFPGIIDPMCREPEVPVLPSYAPDSSFAALSPFGSMYQVPGPSPPASCEPKPAQHHARQRSIYKNQSGLL